MSSDDLIERLEALSVGEVIYGFKTYQAHCAEAAARIDELEAEKTYEARKATVEHCDDPWVCCIHSEEMRFPDE